MKQDLAPQVMVPSSSQPATIPASLVSLLNDVATLNDTQVDSALGNVTAKDLEEAYVLQHARTNSFFSSPEHQWVGNTIHVSGFDAATFKYTTTGSSSDVSYGEILALCGDFYGRHPVSDAFATGDSAANKAAAKQKFLDGPFGCLDGDTGDPKRFQGYTGGDLVKSLHGALNVITSLPSGCKSYGELASLNSDHFARLQSVSLAAQNGGGAHEAYQAGHEAACDAAKNQGTTVAQKATALKKAMALNACASHFLSDLFAPGHLTQSRRAVLAHAAAMNSPVAKVAKNFYTKWMHDEANRAGLKVQNDRGQTWRAYGDNCNAADLNADNRRIQLDALSASAQAVHDTFMDPTQAKYDTCVADTVTKSIWPDSAKAQDLAWLSSNNELSPMFYSTDGTTLLKRGHDCNRGVYLWSSMTYTTFCNAQTYSHTPLDTAEACGGYGTAVTHNSFLMTQKTDPCGGVEKTSGGWPVSMHNVPHKNMMCDGTYRNTVPGVPTGWTLKDCSHNARCGEYNGGKGCLRGWYCSSSGWCGTSNAHRYWAQPEYSCNCVAPAYPVLQPGVSTFDESTGYCATA